MIIPTYKQYLEQGKIEITTSPYYHPILPIMLDIKSAQKNVLFRLLS
jgi:alpha-amylase/alpha-mannosidase (GH57 family)